MTAAVAMKIRLPGKSMAFLLLKYVVQISWPFLKCHRLQLSCRSLLNIYSFFKGTAYCVYVGIQSYS